MEQREIKFRAWEPSTKTMYYKSEQSIHTCFPFIDLQGKLFVFTGEMDEATEGNFILMQFTGLKDKNGKEIYEGDIIQDQHGEEILSVIFNTSMGSWDFQYLGGDSEQMCGEEGWMAENFEIIGNIYQSPELINK